MSYGAEVQAFVFTADALTFITFDYDGEGETALMVSSAPPNRGNDFSAAWQIHGGIAPGYGSQPLFDFKAGERVLVSGWSRNRGGTVFESGAMRTLEPDPSYQLNGRPERMRVEFDGPGRVVVHIAW